MRGWCSGVPPFIERLEHGAAKPVTNPDFASDLPNQIPKSWPPKQFKSKKYTEKYLVMDPNAIGIPAKVEDQDKIENETGEGENVHKTEETPCNPLGYLGWTYKEVPPPPPIEISNMQLLG